MPEKIVCLDSYTLNPGDISWESFHQLGKLILHNQTADQDIVARTQGAPYAMTNKTPLSADTLAQLPELKYIGVLATGYNIVDVAFASKRDIVVTNVPTYGTDSVAQHATALMLELVRQPYIHHEAVQQGQWTCCKDFCFSLAPITELTGKTLGLVGLGRIGRAFARIGAAMGMHLIGHDAYWPSAAQLAGLQIELVTNDEVFVRSDVISLHCPLTDETHHLVNARRLNLMKPTALLINTSRGPLVDNEALAEALRNDTIAGAGLDVLDVEPPPADNPLIGAPHCLITPHIAWYAQEARQRLLNSAAENLKAFINGQPTNRVN